MPDISTSLRSFGRREGLAERLTLLAILVAALSLRLYGLDWDQGHGFHPDERSLYMRAVDMHQVLTNGPGAQGWLHQWPLTEPGLPGLLTALSAERSPLNPHWFPLGSGLIYALTLFLLIAEPFSDWGALELRHVGRVLTALADVGSVAMMYVIGRRLYGTRVGLLAASLTTFAVVHVQIAHFYRPEAFTVLALLACLWAMLRFLDRRRLRDAALMGAMVGLAAATKVPALPVWAPMVLIFLWVCKDRAGGNWSDLTAQSVLRFTPALALAAAMALAAFFITTPYAFLDFGTFIDNIRAEAEMAREAGVRPFTWQYADTPAFIYTIRQTILWGLGIPLGVVAWLAVPATAWLAWRGGQTQRADLLLLAFVVPAFLFLEWHDVKFLRYSFPLMPFCVLMASSLLVQAVEWSADRKRRRLRVGVLSGRWAHRASVAALLLVLVGTVFYCLAFSTIYRSPHPAVAASEWFNQNVPPGTRLVSASHWDEGLPYMGHFDVWTFPAYEPDQDLDKMVDLVSRLSCSDYMYFYSNRVYGSLARLPDQYPDTSAFFRLLFAGEMGFRLERSFANHPELLGVRFKDDPFDRAGVAEPPSPPDGFRGLTLNLGYADENVVNYDHPQVLVFRNVDILTPDEMLRRIRVEAASNDNRPLMLSKADRVAQQNGGTWADVFKRDGWGSRAPWLAWLLVLEALGLLVLPFTWWLMRGLDDRGALLARAIGLLLVSWLTWMLMALDVFEFSGLAILAAAVLATVPSGLVLRKHGKDLMQWVRGNWRGLLAAEALFVVAYLAFVLVRAHNPDLWHAWRGGEKPMELAYLSAVARSSVLPPYDPWFSGGYLNYHYWGYFLLSIPMRITGLAPSVAFNLAVPTMFALTTVAAASLGWNMVRSAAPSAVRPAVAVALFAVVMVVVAGNLDGAGQVLERVREVGVGEALSAPDFDYWRSSRALPEGESFQPSALTPWLDFAGGKDTTPHITEFPFFTFLFADLHPHMMSLPFGLLAVALALGLMMTFRHDRATSVRPWLLTALAGLTVGALWAINAWDYPAYLILLSALVATAFLTGDGTARTRAALMTGAVALAAAVGYCAFLPYHSSLDTLGTGVAWSRWKTPVDSYLVIHALMLTGAASLLFAALPRAVQLARFWNAAPLSGIAKGVAAVGVAGLLASGYMAVAGYHTAALLTVMLALAGSALAAALACGPYPERRSDIFALLLLMAGLGIGVGLDFVRVENDIGRMNSVFKNYLVAWLLLSVAGAYGFWRGWNRIAELRADTRRFVRVCSVSIVLLVLAAALTYPVLGAPARIGDRFERHPLTLDGAAWMKTASYTPPPHCAGVSETPIDLAHDLDAIRWLQQNVQGSPVVLESHGPQYCWTSRISQYTGLPTVLGWPWHQIQQRGDSELVDRRAADVAAMYKTTDIHAALDLLESYDVRYVVVGGMERAGYPASGLAKFDVMAEHRLVSLVYSNPGVRIYEVL